MLNINILMLNITALCGDGTCNATIGEDCITCRVDCPAPCSMFPNLIPIFVKYLLQINAEMLVVM